MCAKLRNIAVFVIGWHDMLKDMFARREEERKEMLNNLRWFGHVCVI